MHKLFQYPEVLPYILLIILIFSILWIACACDSKIVVLPIIIIIGCIVGIISIIRIDTLKENQQVFGGSYQAIKLESKETVLIDTKEISLNPILDELNYQSIKVNKNNFIVLFDGKEQLFDEKRYGRRETELIFNESFNDLEGDKISDKENPKVESYSTKSVYKINKDLNAFDKFSLKLINGFRNLDEYEYTQEESPTYKIYLSVKDYLRLKDDMYKISLQ